MSVPLRWQEPEITQKPIHTPQIPLRRRPSRRIQRMRVALAVGATCLLMGACTALGIRIGSASVNSTQGLRLVSAPSSSGRVTLTNATLERRLGFVTVTGNVFSRAKNAVPNVEATVELLDSKNHTVQMQSALIAYDPLPPGQAAPFRVEMQDDVRAVGYRVRFRGMFRGPLD
jgi:hypothetical protein